MIDSLFGYSEGKNKLLNDPDVPESVKMTIRNGTPSVEYFVAHRETPDKKIEPGTRRTDDVLVYLQPSLRIMSIFEAATEVESDQIAEEKLDWLDSQDAISRTVWAVTMQSYKYLYSATHEYLDTLNNKSQQ